MGYDESSRSFNFLPGGTGVISLICDENLVPPTSIPEDKSWDFIEAVTISEEILKKEPHDQPVLVEPRRQSKAQEG